eukprot:Trichotokara_eunicae@DN5052_c0_g1_i1.p1
MGEIDNWDAFLDEDDEDEEIAIVSSAAVAKKEQEKIEKEKAQIAELTAVPLVETASENPLERISFETSTDVDALIRVVQLQLLETSVESGRFQTMISKFLEASIDKLDSLDYSMIVEKFKTISQLKTKQQPQARFLGNTNVKKTMQNMNYREEMNIYDGDEGSEGEDYFQEYY